MTSSTRRRSLPFAFDPRLAVGLGLVIASVVGVYLVVAAADRTSQVYAAASDLAPGDRVTADDLEVRDVRLDGLGSYLVPGDLPAAGVVLTRVVSAGELVPSAAVGDRDGVRMTSLVLSVDGELAASVGPGSTVDVWSAREAESGRFEAPAVIVGDATVVRLVHEDTLVAAGATTGVEVLVPKARLARVLEALANGDAISVVPATLPVGG